jgi:hypothetical protein
MYDLYIQAEPLGQFISFYSDEKKGAHLWHSASKTQRGKPIFSMPRRVSSRVVKINTFIISQRHKKQAR